MLPAFLRNKKAIVTVPGPVQKSLAYCYLAHLRKQNLKRRLKDYNIEYNLRKLYNIEYPVTPRHLNFIRYDLHQILNIYTIDDEAGHERRCIYFNNPRASERTPNVLFYKGRFYLIRNFNKFAGGNIKSRRRRYYCERCLAPLTTLDKWHAHQPACKQQVTFALRVDGKSPIEAESLPEECEPGDVAQTKDLKGKGMMSASEMTFGKFVPNFDDRSENEDDVPEAPAIEDDVPDSPAIEEDTVSSTQMEEDNGHVTVLEDKDEQANDEVRVKKMEEGNDRGNKADDKDPGRKMEEQEKQVAIEEHNIVTQTTATEIWHDSTTMHDDMEIWHDAITMGPDANTMQFDKEAWEDTDTMRSDKDTYEDANTVQASMETCQDAHHILANVEGKGYARAPLLTKEPFATAEATLKGRRQPKANVKARIPSNHEPLSTPLDKHARLRNLLALKLKHKEERSKKAEEANIHEGPPTMESMPTHCEWSRIEAPRKEAMATDAVSRGEDELEDGEIVD